MNYFLQTQSWMNFWANYNKTSHQVHFFEEGFLSCYIQEYPWHFGGKFWYIPKAPVIDSNANLEQITPTQIKKNLNYLYIEILRQAKIQGAVFIKNDFDDTLTTRLGLFGNHGLANFLEAIPALAEYKIQSGTKKIQYLECTYCELDYPNHDLASGSLQQFWDSSQPFWSNCNEQVRRYTRKALKDYNKSLYTINTDKTPENFEAFWQVHRDTTLRQNFSTQPKDYLKEFMNADFGRIITVRDAENKPTSVWLGVKMGDTLYYILGGNTDQALKSRTQYLLQLAAVRQASVEHCKYYDMGGYEAGSGYGQFKDGYKGTHRQFLGPIDIVLDPIKYTAAILAYKTAKSIKKILGK